MPFVKGRSGNPGGRPKETSEVRALARKHTRAAIDTLVEILNDADKDAARVAAATALLDRGWGKPIQTVGGPDGGPIPFSLTINLGAD